MSLRVFRLLRYFSVLRSDRCRSPFICSQKCSSFSQLANNVNPPPKKILSEIAFAHSILEENPMYSEIILPPFVIGQRINNFAEMINSVNWLNLSAHELIVEFEKVSPSSDVPITHEICSDLCRAIMKICPQLSDDQLVSLFKNLALWPLCESAFEKTYYQLWSEFDNVCLSRWKKWDIKTNFVFMELWYHMHLTKTSKFVYKAATKFALSPRRLTKEQVVILLFYLSILRTTTKNTSMFEIEYRLSEIAHELTLDEIAVAVMGFFKGDKSLFNEKLMGHLVDRLISEASTVSDITFTAIIKELRRSLPTPLWPRATELADSITTQVDRLSLPASVHGLLFATRPQLRHPPLLGAVSRKLVSKISEARLKELEKAMFALAQLDFDPETNPCIFDTISRELDNPSREAEITQYPKCYIALVHYFCLRGMILEKHVRRVLDKDFIRLAYGPKKFNYGRELLFIDCCAELECPGYLGPRLPSDIRKYLAERYSEYLPDPGRKMTRHLKWFYDLIQAAEVLFGRENIALKYLLPNHPRAEIIVRLDEGGKPLQMPDEVKNSPPFEDLLKAPDSSYYCLVAAGKNMYLYDSNNFLNGEASSKLRQIKLLGFNPILVSHEFWPTHGTLEKVEHLKHLISTSCR